MCYPGGQRYALIFKSGVFPGSAVTVSDVFDKQDGLLPSQGRLCGWSAMCELQGRAGCPIVEEGGGGGQLYVCSTACWRA